MDVVMVRWPDDRDRRELLIAEGVPRLLLLRDGADAPVPSDCLEDWIRVPADERELRARVDGLRQRSHLHDRGLPQLDEHGVVRYGGHWVALPPVEARLASALLERFGSVVSRDALERAGWPDASVAGRNALDVHVLRLRRRLRTVGLAITTVRARGYLLEDTTRSGSAAIHANSSM